MERSGTVLILVGRDGEGRARIIETASDDGEVGFLQQVLADPHADPVAAVRERRTLREQEENAFADYVEGLVSSPSCGIELRRQAGLWFRSRIHLETYRAAEVEARRVIVEFAIRLFEEDPNRTDFTLASEFAEVRVLIHEVKSECTQPAA